MPRVNKPINENNWYRFHTLVNLHIILFLISWLMSELLGDDNKSMAVAIPLATQVCR